jgi:hypothetical protein
MKNIKIIVKKKAKKKKPEVENESQEAAEMEGFKSDIHSDDTARGSDSGQVDGVRRLHRRRESKERIFGGALSSTE